MASVAGTSSQSSIPESLLTAVVRIENREREGLPAGRAAFASGFLVRASEDGRIFLVTNKHVTSLNGTHFGPKVSNLLLHLNVRSKDGRYRKSDPIPLSLQSEQGPLWKDHPSEDVDITVTEVSELLGQHTDLAYHPLDISDIRSSEQLIQEGIDAGSEVFILGYPFNVTTTESNLPIVRRGIIASKLGESLQAELPPGSQRVIALKGFFIDAMIAGSSSGGPVVMRRASAGEEAQAFWVVGVVQGFSMAEPLDLGRVHYGELVSEAIAQFFPTSAEVK